MTAPVAQQEQDRCPCGTPITWAVHEGTLKEAPIETEPSNDGNVVLTDRPGRLPTYVVLNAAKQFGRTGLHKNHANACPQAPKWRNR